MDFLLALFAAAVYAVGAVYTYRLSMDTLTAGFASRLNEEFARGDRLFAGFCALVWLPAGLVGTALNRRDRGLPMFRVQ